MEHPGKLSGCRLGGCRELLHGDGLVLDGVRQQRRVRDLVGLAFLREAGFNVPADVVDVMLEFAPIYGERNGRRGGYRWQKLATCASYYGAPEFDAHNSLGDAQATAWCYSAMSGTASA